MKIEKEVRSIKKRNKRVESDKAWEVSKTRKVIIAVLTYIVIVVFFWSADIEKPFLNAIVPSVAFVLSTFTLPFFKKYWINRYNK
jgi:hypothetical protein